MSILNFAIALKTVANNNLEEIVNTLEKDKLKLNSLIKLKELPNEAETKTKILEKELTATLNDETILESANNLANEWADDWNVLWNSHVSSEMNEIDLAVHKMHSMARDAEEVAAEEAENAKKVADAVKMAELTADLKEAAINAQVRNIGMKIAVIKANQAFAKALGAMAVINEKTLKEEIAKTENTKILAETIANEAEKMKGRIRAGNRYASVDEMINIIKQQMNLSDDQSDDKNILYSKLVEEAKKEAESLDAQDAKHAARLAAEAEMTGSTIMRSNAVGT